MFAQQQGECDRQRHFIRAGGAGNRIAADAHRHRRIKVVAHARIGLRAQRFVADLLDQIETGPGRGIAWRGLGVQRFVMVAQPQRHRIGMAARFHRLVARQVAARHRHPQVLAIGHRHIGSPGHLKFRLVRDCPAGAGQDRAEAVKRGFVGHGLPDQIDCPVLAQSAMKPSMPLSVRMCLNSPLMTEGGAVITSAPIFAASSTWMPWRTEATRISVSKA